MSQALLPQPSPAPGQGLAACVALNWGEGGYDWTLTGKGFWAGLTLPAFAFHSALGNILISWGRVSEVRGMRSGIFIGGQSFPEVLASLCSASLLSFPRSPNSARMSVTHPALHTDTHTPFLAAGATNSSSAPPEAAQGPGHPERQDSALGLGAGLPGSHCSCPTHPCQFSILRAGEERWPHQPLLCHWARAEIPLAEKAQFQ